MKSQKRYHELTSFFQVKFTIGTAVAQTLKAGYSRRDFGRDALAGIVVGMVAIPLGMALAIATGVPPQYGLYTVIVAGLVVALFGGSHCQVTGPTAAFVVILAPIVQQYGLSGLLISGFLAGVLLVLMGLFRMGRLIEFIPHPVVTGFTSGIAVVIATIQLKDFFGLRFSRTPETFFDRVRTLWEAKASWSPIEFLVGVGTLLLLIYWPKVSKKIPAPLVALSISAVVVIIVRKIDPTISVATIGSRFSGMAGGQPFHGIPAAGPTPLLPWSFPTPSGQFFSLSVDTVQTLMSSAFAIAMLGAIESLLSAVVADGMAQTQHDPDSELIALGIGNMVCPFFGGIPATGAIARTATNIRFGGRSPFAAMTHAVFVLLAVLILAPLVSALPMASLAALLILVAYNMSEAKHFTHILKVAPLSDVLVLLICFTLTVVFDMVVGVTVGVVLAALLLMRRIAEMTHSEVFEVGKKHPELKAALPKGVVLYEIAGPLLFGAAQQAMGTLALVDKTVKVVIFDMESVPTMDVTGLVALETAIAKLSAANRCAILTGVQKEPEALIRRSGLIDNPDRCRLAPSLERAVELARQSL